MAVPLPGEVVALVAALVSSVGYVSAHRGLADVSAEVLVTATTAVSVALLLPVVVVTGGFDLSPVMTAAFVASGLLGSGLGRFLLSHAISRTGAGVAHAVKSASPVTAAVFSVVVLGERITPRLAVGILVVVLGLVLLTQAHTDDGRGASVSTAVVLSLVVVLWFGVTPVVRKYGLSVLDAPLLPALTVNFAVGLVVGLALSLRNGPGQLRRVVAGRARGFLLLTGVCWTGAITLYFLALSLAEAVVVVPIFNSSPLFTLLLSVVLFGERDGTGLPALLGGLVTVAGVVLITLA